MQIWTELNIFIPKTNRCCPKHLEKNMFSEKTKKKMSADKEGLYISEEEVLYFMNRIGVKSNKYKSSFDFDIEIEDVDFAKLVGFSKINFESILPFLDKLNSSKNRSTRNALGMFLMMLRHNLSQVRVFFDDTYI